MFDRFAKHAGAGTLVPITGFANAVVAPAMEFKQEGMITGTAAKLFTVAGPVLVYGISASVVYGVVLYIAQRVGGSGCPAKCPQVHSSIAPWQSQGIILFSRKGGRCIRCTASVARADRSHSSAERVTWKHRGLPFMVSAA